MKKFLGLSVIVLLAATLALPVGAQDFGAAFVVFDQVSVNGMVNFESVTLDQPGWLVIHADDGAGAPGNTLGTLYMESGTYPDVWVPIDMTLATPLVFAMIHKDDNEIGTFEFGAKDGADAPVEVNGEPVMASFNIAAIQVYDQLITSGQFAISSVTSPQNGWLAIHADESGTPGEVLGYTAVNDGTTADLSVTLSDAVTPIVWPVLHADTGIAGEFEFGTVEGADEAISVGNQNAALPIWTAPHVRVYDQPLGTSNELWFSQVLLDQSGWLVIHADDGGAPGEVLGYSSVLPVGLSTGVVVVIEPSTIGNTVWAMLHYDTGTAATYEFGEVDGADMPVLDAGGSPVMDSLVILPPEQPVDGEAEALESFTSETVSLTEWGIVMPASIPAGKVVFTVTNDGTVPHNFEIEGNGVEQGFETDLAPGETRTLEIELSPGTYRIYCPVSDHAESGMEFELTVTG
ncbi:MAG: cupredoxin domain-containing protein [Chloroflexi bacterium]|nr:cupredoxin domain-containing protein [Chloroflexota bacterium]